MQIGLEWRERRVVETADCGSLPRGLESETSERRRRGGRRGAFVVSRTALARSLNAADTGQDDVRDTLRRAAELSRGIIVSPARKTYRTFPNPYSTDRAFMYGAIVTSVSFSSSFILRLCGLFCDFS